MKCFKCGGELDNLGIALTKKLINRGSTQFMCKKCLAAYFNVSESLLIKKASEFKKQGCKLFDDCDV